MAELGHLAQQELALPAGDVVIVEGEQEGYPSIVWWSHSRSTRLSHGS
jgi:hypothetical protein